MNILASADLEQQINQLSVRIVLIASLLLIICTVIAVLMNKYKRRLKKYKLPLFLIMVATVVCATLFMSGGTVYLNTKAESKGPVHWHSDIEFWVCGTELELRDPHGFLSNKIGTATYHEHNDKRIHLEGVVVKKSEDASLRKFMSVTGGYITDDSIGIPLNDDQADWIAKGEKTDGDKQNNSADYLGIYAIESQEGPVLQLKNGDNCGQNGELQVFVYSYNKKDNTYSQTKIEHPPNYIMRDESVVPPGDCVIVEFDAPKDSTDKLCLQYGVRDAERCTLFGVKQFNPDLCNAREVTTAEGEL